MVRMLYLMFVHLTSWMALLARSATSKDAELLVLRLYCAKTCLQDADLAFRAARLLCGIR